MFLEALRGSYVHLIPSALGFIVFSSLALISLLRGRNRGLSLIFAALCGLGGLINLDTVLVSLISDRSTALAVDRLIYLLFVFSVYIYIRFIHAFLEISGRRRLETAALVACALFSILTQTRWFIPEFAEHDFGRVARPGAAYHVFMLYGVAAAAYCIHLLLRSLRTTQNRQQGSRVRYVLGGVGLGAVLLCLHYLPVSGLSEFSPGSLSFIPALALSYGVLKYDLLDFGTFVRRGTAYLVLTVMLAAFQILIIYAFHAVFMRSGAADSIAVPLIFAALIVVFFDPLRKRTQSVVDRVLFKGRYDYRRILGEMRQFVSEQVYQEVRNDTASIRPASRRVTVLFCDIRNFSALSGTFNPEDLSRLLDEHYFSPLDDVIFEKKGTLDKHIGDSIMGIFGAPVSCGDDARRAVESALAMQEEMDRVNGTLSARGIALSIGIGISTGEAMAGVFGSNRKKEYTVFGEVVNLASRLEHLAGSGEILICEETARKVMDTFRLETTAPVRLKGIDRDVKIYRVIGLKNIDKNSLAM